MAGNLLIYPAEHVIYGDYMYEAWDEDMIKHLLGFFMPENMRIDVVSKSFAKSQGNLITKLSVSLDDSVAWLNLL